MKILKNTLLIFFAIFSKQHKIIIKQTNPVFWKKKLRSFGPFLKTYFNLNSEWILWKSIAYE